MRVQSRNGPAALKTTFRFSSGSPQRAPSSPLSSTAFLCPQVHKILWRHSCFRRDEHPLDQYRRPCQSGNNRCKLQLSTEARPPWLPLGTCKVLVLWSPRRRTSSRSAAHWVDKCPMYRMGPLSLASRARYQNRCLSPPRPSTTLPSAKSAFRQSLTHTHPAASGRRPGPRTRIDDC